MTIFAITTATIPILLKSYPPHNPIFPIKAIKATKAIKL